MGSWRFGLDLFCPRQSWGRSGVWGASFFACETVWIPLVPYMFRIAFGFRCSSRRTNIGAEIRAKRLVLIPAIPGMVWEDLDLGGFLTTHVVEHSPTPCFCHDDYMIRSFDFIRADFENVSYGGVQPPLSHSLWSLFFHPTASPSR